MNHRIMEENLTRLLQDIDYKSCGSQPEPYELTQNGSNAGGHGHYIHGLSHNNMFMNGGSKHQQQAVKNEEKKESDQLVNPFDKKLFKERRLRRSSVCYLGTREDPEINRQIYENKSMINLKDQINKLNVCQQGITKPKKSMGTESYSGLATLDKKLIIKKENYEILEQSCQRSKQAQQLSELFEQLGGMLTKIKQTAAQNIMGTQSAAFNKTKENIRYLIEYLSYHYESELRNVQIDKSSINHQVATHYSSNQQNNYIYCSQNNPILQISNCHPENYHYDGQENNPNYDNVYSNLKYMGSSNKRSNQKHKRQSEKKQQNLRRVKVPNGAGPRSIYQSVLEERRNRKQVKKY